MLMFYRNWKQVQWNSINKKTNGLKKSKNEKSSTLPSECPARLSEDWWNGIQINVWVTAEASPNGVCVTLSGKFPYAPYNYLTNGAGSEQTLRCHSHIVRLQCSKRENKCTIFYYYWNQQLLQFFENGHS